ncbi:MAG: hypothetical protein ACF8R7_05310 [Phycisphaerales bacterium JB039]
MKSRKAAPAARVAAQEAEAERGRLRWRMALVRAVADGESAEAWASALATDWPASARVIKREGDRAVWRAQLRDQEVIIKTWGLRGRRRVQSLVLLSPAWRHWRAGHRLLQRGIRAARPIALGAEVIEGKFAEALVLDFVPGPTALEALVRPLGSAEERGVARAVGEQTGAIVRAGLYNRDHKPSNLIVCDVSAEAAEVAVIDCVGFRRAWGSESALAQMLAKLLIEPLGCGLRPRRAVRWRVLRSAAGDNRDRCKRLWGAVDRIVAAHGDPAPKINPLAAGQKVDS